jgi:glycosyltransferase involved in cell wall biosynthesis
MSDDQVSDMPWASFCMSTFNRPEFLRAQVGSLLEQTFIDFEIVISDNDPNGSGRTALASFNDERIKYQCNEANVGMVKSFNRSVERARGRYIVMVTDDDPVVNDFLEIFHKIITDNPGYSIYGGLERKNRMAGEMEMIKAADFVVEFLDPDKTSLVLWSSCLFKKEALLQIGKLPDYGGPHLVDHAMLAMAGSIDGALLVNKMYSNIVYHQTNFSKSNFNSYYISCAEFYNLLHAFIKGKPGYQQKERVIIKHLGKWFISFIFGLLNYYGSAKNYNAKNLDEIKEVAERIIQLPFMASYRFKYRVKALILNIKFTLGIKK